MRLIDSIKRSVCAIDPAAPNPAVQALEPSSKHRRDHGFRAGVKSATAKMCHAPHLPPIAGPRSLDGDHHHHQRPGDRERGASPARARPRRAYHSVNVPPPSPAPVVRKPYAPLTLHVERQGPSPYDDASLTYVYALFMLAWTRPTASFGVLAPIAPAIRGVSVGAMLAAPVMWPIAMAADAWVYVSERVPRSWLGKPVPNSSAGDAPPRPNNSVL